MSWGEPTPAWETVASADLPRFTAVCTDAIPRPGTVLGIQ